ncbi:MAG: peptide ABC transporter substrate-binding protein [Clostridiales bacterium]|nr:peptide ABC transporter substrate-binding protein [Clostridiales bacterium]
MKALKNTTAIFLALTIIAAAFAGCSSDSGDIDLIYPFSGNINSYDPQVSAEADEYLLIENCFEGLVRCNDDGEVVPGCASSWEISDDGLTYTFHLYQGLKWYIYNSVKERMGEDWNPEITAADFVFALQRAADSNTACPLYSSISCIKNAPEIHAGSKSTSKLGVRAVDDYTLEITLSYADDGFLETLSTAVAMPCNEEFFNATNGRYGLDLQYIMFNGQFIITNELESSYILKQNSAYAGPSAAKAAVLTLNIVDSDADVTESLLSGYYDAAYIRGYESISIKESDGITLSPYSNITWVLIINAASSNEILADKSARQALVLAISDISLDDYDYLSNATGIIPPSCTVNGKSYTENASDITAQSDSEKAVSLWKEAVESTGIYEADLSVLVPEGLLDASKRLIQGIQGSIGAISSVDSQAVDFSIKIESLSESELKSEVASGEWDIALYPFEASSEDAVSFLQSVSDSNITSFDSDEFDAMLDSLDSLSASELKEKCRSCEKELIETYCYAPLFFETNYYAQAKGVSGVQFHAGTGRVSFVFATRAD